jgi:hypothetical protein
MRHAAAAILLACSAAWAAADPFANTAKVHVLLFVRSDCPIANRYAPELARIAKKFADRGVDFWLIYPDASETEASVERHRTQYSLPGVTVLDPGHNLVKRAAATISPQAAVFDRSGRLAYSGRIDDRYLAFGKARPEPTTHDLEAGISTVLAGKQIAEPRTHAVGCYLADLK